MTNPVPERSPTGQLLKGHTAAPAGKPRRKRIPASMLREVVGQENIEKLLRNGMEDAIANPAGQWAFFFANKLVAPMAPQKQPVELPIAADDNPVTMAKVIMAETGKGAIPPDTASALLQSLAALNSMIEVEELKTQIEEMKQVLASTRL